MKKLLLNSTILAAGLIGTTAYADGPTITLGGYADFQLGLVDQEAAYEADANIDALSNVYNRNEHTRFVSNLFVTIDGQTDNGLGYGAYLELEAGSSAPEGTAENRGDIERGYVFLQGLFGRVEMGSNSDAGDALRVDAGSFARATGGISGDWWRYVDIDNNATGAIADGFYGYYVVPGLPTASMPRDRIVGTYEERAVANKITFYTPKVEGFQLGVSYTPDQGEKGSSTGFSSSYSAAGTTTTPDFENVINAGVSFERAFGDVDFKASATGEWGDVEDTSATVASLRDDLEAYSVGLNVSYVGVTVGGSYAKIEEFGAIKTAGTGADYWTVGAAYENGPMGVSVGYLESKVENTSGGSDAEVKNISFGADYQLAPGLVPYVEVNLFDLRDNNATTVTDNDGSVILLGTELSF